MKGIPYCIKGTFTPLEINLAVETIKKVRRVWTAPALSATRTA